MEWSIGEVAKRSGVTSRTLRHYESIGLLLPSSTGTNGYRYYDEAALVRLQRILLLRELGVGLSAVADALAGRGDDVAALETHLGWLHGERSRITTQIGSVSATLAALKGKEKLMPEQMFEGFDHTQHKAEVEERWGAKAYADGDKWWRGLGEDGKKGFLEEQARIQDAFSAAQTAGLGPESDEAQAAAARQFDWVKAGWNGKAPSAEAFTGLGEMYVADERFGKNYTRVHATGAEFVRDAMRVYAERNLA
ncbi:DNA-binding transcriptional MerR regulator [Pseudoclavibacter sp. JAI123]|uniref:MerR family transcriptional regulator n=1 Tax=Pseudoclavibacter sp. JAI123 TaxID=2723065 RepID=UPI0015C77E3D|nr:MerR family transcriptional regulator [Pseudoclavibacter sp. JAI123]NYF13173.1 DNA-binding transcriptional MerR regulator [Pseudoclavibacter sp. JAI123]